MSVLGAGFHAAKDARRVADLIKRSSAAVTVVKSGMPPQLIYASVNHEIGGERGEFKVQIDKPFLDMMEGRPAVFHVSDADYKRIPPSATLKHAGTDWLVSVAIPGDVRQGITIEWLLLCDSGLYPHRCDVWSETDAVLDGIPQPRVLTLVKANQPCYFSFTPNVDQPESLGRVKAANANTRDTVHFPYDCVIENGGYLVDRTRQNLSPNAPKSHTYGAVSKIQGAPQYTHPSALRYIGKLTVNTMTDEQPPRVIREAYAS